MLVVKEGKEVGHRKKVIYICRNLERRELPSSRLPELRGGDWFQIPGTSDHRGFNQKKKRTKIENREEKAYLKGKSFQTGGDQFSNLDI